MTAGLNTKITIWRVSTSGQADDAVGGAQPTGTVAHQNVLARIEANPEEQLLLQQGLETVRTFNAVIIPPNLDIRERDELEITEPTDHFYYGVRFRITGIRNSSHNPRDPRGYMILSLTRSVRAHSIQ